MDTIRRQFRSAIRASFANRVALTVALILVVELNPAGAFAQNTWSEYPQTVPSPRYDSALTLFGQQVIIAGGFSPSSGNLTSTLACQLCTSTSGGWEGKPDMPSVQTAPAYASGLVAGGNNGSGPVATLSLLVSPPSWRTLTSMPTARQAPAGATDGGFFYVMGGNTGSGVTGVLEVYNFSSNSWTSAAPMLTPRSDLGADTINGVIYAAGGSDSSGPALATLEAYDPTTNTWAAKASMPTPRADLAVVALHGLLYAIGGRGADGSPLATVEAYDPVSDTWTTAPSMPTARWGLSAVVAPESEQVPSGPKTIWAIGGALDAAGNTATGANEVFLPPCGTVNVTPTSLSFNHSGTKTVTVTNTGSVYVDMVSAFIGNGNFNITSDTCSGNTLTQSSSCAIAVMFTNFRGTKFTSTLTITDSACNSPQTVSLTGR